MTISSKDNEKIRRMRRLLTDAKYRRSEGMFVMEGARLCEDAVLSGAAIDTALITERARSRYSEQVERVENAAARSFDITEQVAAFLSDTDTAQGIICLCKALDNRKMLDTIDVDISFTFKNKKWLALESVRDPGNIGTVIRTAEAMGVDGLLLSADCCDVYSPKVLRGSMGGVFRLPIFETASIPGAICRLQEAGVPAFACVPFSGPEVLPVTAAPLDAGCLCVVGNEANGLTAQTVEACRYKVTIPMAGRAESLNAAVAASIVLWEMVRG